jgi:hypothetical protein
MKKNQNQLIIKWWNKKTIKKKSRDVYFTVYMNNVSKWFPP